MWQLAGRRLIPESTVFLSCVSDTCHQVTRAIHHVIGRRFVTLQYELLTAASSDLLIKVCSMRRNLSAA